MTNQLNPNDLIELKAWILKQLDKHTIKADAYRGILRGIVKSKKGVVFSADAMPSSSGKKRNEKTLRSQISRVNRYLMAAASFAHQQHDKYWDLSLSHRGVIKQSTYKADWVDSLSKVARSEQSPESFFEAWLKCGEIDPILRPKKASTKASKEARIAAERTQIDAVQTQLFRDLAQSITNRTPVILVGFSEDRLDEKIVYKLSGKWGGTPIHISEASLIIRFEYLDDERLAAVRAMESAHEFLWHCADVEKKSGPAQTTPVRLLLRECEDNDILSKRGIDAEIRVIQHAALGKPAGEVYLDRSLWRSVGQWANAIRQPPSQIVGTGKEGEAWARLEGFGEGAVVFNSSTIESTATLVCRETQQNILEEAWQQVVTSNQVVRVSIKGKNGSGKRSLVDCFMRDRIHTSQSRYCTLDFTQAAIDYPYGAFIDIFTQVVDFDPQATASDRREQAGRALRGYSKVTKRNIDDVLMVFDKLRPDDRRTGNIFAPANASARHQRLHESLSRIARAAMKQMAQQSPLVIVAYDLHRASPACARLFQELCDYAGHSIAHLPILLVSTQGPTTKHAEIRIRSDRTIEMGEFSNSEMDTLNRSFESQRLHLADDRVQSFLDTQENLPGRFVDQVVLADSGGDAAQRCNAVLARFFRPQESIKHPTLHSSTVGAITLLALVGGQADVAVLCDILTLYAKVEGLTIADVARHGKCNQAQLTTYLDRAYLAGILNRKGREGSVRGLHYCFKERTDVLAIQCRVRKNIAPSQAILLAQAFTASDADADAKLWEAAATLISQKSSGYLPYRYWRGAAFGSLRQGQPDMARHQFYKAFWFACGEARELETRLHKLMRRRGVMAASAAEVDQKKDSVGLAWVRALQAYRCYIHANRLQDISPRPQHENRFRQLMGRSSVRKRTDRSHFDARLSQWHFADVKGKHRKAYKAVILMRGALDRQVDCAVTQQQQLELSYAAWATAIAHGRLGHAIRYFGQMMALNALPHEKKYDSLNLSSGHDLELYVPARHAAVAWLTGDYSAVYSYLDLLLDRLDQLHDEDAYRRFWAAAYLLPLALVERCELANVEKQNLALSKKLDGVIARLLSHLNSTANMHLGATVAQITALLSDLAKLPQSETPLALRHLLKNILDRKAPGTRSGKHRSVWLCLIGRRWLALDEPCDLQLIKDSLDEAIRECHTDQELFLMAELLRQRAHIDYRRGDMKRCKQNMTKAIECARSQGAVTLELQIIRDHLQLKLYSKKKNIELRERLRALFEECDFPMNHPVAQDIKKVLAATPRDQSTQSYHAKKSGSSADA